METELQLPGALVIAKPHPLSSELVRAEFPAGLTIAEIIGPDAKCCHVEIGGMTIPEEYWPLVRPKPGVAVIITRYPQGGGAKNVLRIIAFAALAVGVGLIAAPGGFFVASLGLGQIAATGLAAAVGILGTLAINALIPPTVPNVSAAGTLDRLRSITGSSNQANPYGAIPCALGTIRMFPPLAALPYSEVSGDDQYLRMLFDLGYGNLSVSDMKIGDSDLSNFTDVQFDVGTNPTLYSNAVAEVPVTTEMDTDFSVATKTSGANADELSIDLIFPNGLISVDSKGNSKQNTCDVKVEYSPAGANTWSNVTTATGMTISNWTCQVNGTNFRVTTSDRKVLRVGIRWQVTHGQYDVRVTRQSTVYGGTSAQTGQMQWSVLRTISHTVPSTTGTTKIAMRIKATDQLNGTLNQFNCIVSQQIPVWNGSAWVTGSSSNPAFLYRWILEDSPANPRQVDPARINDQDLIDWAADCDAKEFTFDGVVDQVTTIFDLIRDVCAAGRASFTMRDGKYTVVRDIAQSTPVQHFTPRNSWGFAGSRVFPIPVHALRVQFLNPAANYAQDERIVYADGYNSGNATNFETFQIRGCTNANGAWRLGRYHLAVLTQRPNSYVWNADIENLICNRGSLVQFAHDVISEGLAWGRVKSVLTDGTHITGVVVDEPVAMDGLSTYGIRIRTQSNTSLTTNLQTATGDAINGLLFVTPQAIGSINAGDLFLFGIAGQESIQMLVTKIEPASDLAAKITAVDYAPGVLTADSGTPPAFTSQITGQPWNDAPPPPSIVIITSNQLTGDPGDDGSTDPGISVGVGPGSRPIREPSQPTRGPQRYQPA